MELTYKILGGDGNQYGPVTAGQFQDWVREGRAHGETQVLRSDSSNWRAAATFPELGVTSSAPEQIPQDVPAARDDAESAHRIKSGASWFYWITAMSLINSFLVVAKQPWGFAIGMGITREIDYALSGAPIVAFALSLLACGVMAMFGFFAIKGQSWAFIIGLALLALDTALTVFQQAWISVAFHAWAIVSIFGAFRVARTLRR